MQQGAAYLQEKLCSCVHQRDGASAEVLWPPGPCCLCVVCQSGTKPEESGDGANTPGLDTKGEAINTSGCGAGGWDHGFP